VLKVKSYFYVIVAFEYLNAGGPPPSWFIDDLMRAMERPYYVGLLSAATHLPIAHPRSQDLRANVKKLPAFRCPTPTNRWPLAWRPNGVDPRTTSRTFSSPGQFRHSGPAICGRQMETVMILEQAQRLADLTERLSEALMTAAICADDIRAILPTELDSYSAVRWERSQDAKLQNPPRWRPLGRQLNILGAAGGGNLPATPHNPSHTISTTSEVVSQTRSRLNESTGAGR